MDSNDDPFAKHSGHRRHRTSTRAQQPHRVDHASRSLAPGASPFSEPAKRLDNHPLEKALFGLVLAHLVFLPWALGTMVLWAQEVSLALATASFVVALIPRNYSAEQTGMQAFRMLPAHRLLRFPLFWLGLTLLALVTCHALNPAWDYRTNGRGWWMQAVPHLTWLPSGVRVPFEMWGPWRMLMIYSSAWMTVCAIWIGFTRRRTLRGLFIAFALNGVALAGLGIAQQLGHAGKIFWSVESPNSSFFASFIYKNHAGAYLVLALAATCGLSAWYYVRGVRRLEKSNPSALTALLSAVIAVSIVLSLARGATFTMIGYLLLVLVGFVLFQRRAPAHARNPGIAIAMAVIVGGFVYFGFRTLDSGFAWERLRSALSGQDLSVLSRQEANKASLEALSENWAAGIGSGSFRFLYPIYAHRHPEVEKIGFWEHAHNDVLEIPMELGLPGMLLVLAAFGYYAAALARVRAWRNPLTGSVITGCLLLLGMSWGDFVFQCPAVLVTWCAFWTTGTRWAQLEEERRKAASTSA